MRIGVFGHYGNENLGDEAIIEACINSLSKLAPEAEIVQFSIRPLDSEQRHQTRAYPIRVGGEHAQNSEHAETLGTESVEAENHVQDNLLESKLSLYRRMRSTVGALVRLVPSVFEEMGFLVRSYKRLKGTDLLLVAGSNQFLDNFGGVGGFPYTLFKWSVLCRICSVKLAFVSVGAGPIESSVSLLLIRFAIRFADYVSFRDDASRQLVMGHRSDGTYVYPDLASNLDFAIDRSPGANKRLVVGINPMPMYDSRYWCEADEGKYASYIAQLSEFVKLLLENEHQVFLFSTQSRDTLAIDDVLACLREGKYKNLDKQVKKVIPTTSQELMTVIQSADVVVPTRFHGTVLSLVANRPVVGVCYYRKAADLLTDMGQQDYFEMLDELSAVSLFAKFNHLVDNIAREREKIQNISRRYREQLDEQYTQLLKLVST